MSDSIVERVRSSGVSAASTHDLIAIGFSRREQDANEAEVTARNVLSRAGKIAYLPELAFLDVQELTGLEPFEVLRTQALMELGRRADLAGKGNALEIPDPQAVSELLRHLQHEKREHFCVLLLDSKNSLIRWTTVHIGTLTMSVVGIREVFREAIREGASGIVVAHNHPSGDVTPSPEDIEVTAKLKEVGKMLDIPLLDHVILGDRSRFLSFAREGML